MDTQTTTDVTVYSWWRENVDGVLFRVVALDENFVQLQLGTRGFAFWVTRRTLFADFTAVDFNR